MVDEDSRVLEQSSVGKYITGVTLTLCGAIRGKAASRGATLKGVGRARASTSPRNCEDTET